MDHRAIIPGIAIAPTLTGIDHPNLEHGAPIRLAPSEKLQIRDDCGGACHLDFQILEDLLSVQTSIGMIQFQRSAGGKDDCEPVIFG
jgi:hypothetical protein